MGNYIGRFIKIREIPEIIDFSKHATKVEGDVVCRRGKWSVDAKSLMGLFSIDTAEGFIVEVDDSEKEFLEYIKKFEQ